MNCPKCGHQQPEGAECAACGVIFSKLRDSYQPAEDSSRFGAEPLAEVTQGTGVPVNPHLIRSVLFLAAAVAFSVGLYVWWQEGGFRAASEIPGVAGAKRRTTAAADVSRAGGAGTSPVQKSPTRQGGSEALEAWTISGRPLRVSDPDLTMRLAKSLPAASSYWHEGALGYEDAEQEQRESGLPLLLYVHTDWCRYCKVFEDNVLPSYEAIKLLDRVVKARLDPEKGSEEKAIANRYGVKGYPALFVVKTPGGRAQRLSDGDGDPVKFYREGRSILATENATDLLRDGNRLLEARKFAAALDVLDQVLELEPDNPQAYMARARAYDQGGAPERAIDDVTLALSVSGEDLTGYEYLAGLCLDVGRNEDAARTIGQLLALDPTDRGGAAHFLRGAAFYRMEDLAGALADAAKACELGHTGACQIQAYLRPPTTTGNMARAVALP